ncbi:hypothetical protein IMG5_097480 [Ichthyophthirius multifiliis]|uniref:Transmembrane protein n=1 Tax=Ichthyophthirius multifiliis TaxID=5932 RepID=G0QRT7_ICHMU|nr:hypothetical protein IMG5_097480 [Ichthyophthirius multifiliis]EGR32071.1 hypothetical protein IMG5_097480 [Ichthyophthirius multifiliis]|eukprot:XP_004035557.1 hypothetical protein IMG5_097480 [Ichthyophthirius multifiliis]
MYFKMIFKMNINFWLRWVREIMQGFFLQSIVQQIKKQQQNVLVKKNQSIQKMDQQKKYFLIFFIFFLIIWRILCTKKLKSYRTQDHIKILLNSYQPMKEIIHIIQFQEYQKENLCFLQSKNQRKKTNLLIKIYNQQ